MRGFSRQGSNTDIKNNLADNPLLNGVLLENIPLAAGMNEIEHGLGRPVRGMIVVLSTGNFTLSNEGYGDMSNELQIRLLKIRSSAAGTVSLWVF